MVLSRLGEDQLLALAGVLAIALVGTAVFPAPIWTAVTGNTGGMTAGDSDADGGDEQVQDVTHRHGHLFFYVNGERREFSENYLERKHAAHFHHDDGIFHIHKKGVTIDDLFTAVGATVEDGCLTFEPDDEEYCTDGSETELRVYLNNATVNASTWQDHEVQQGDNIVVYYGDADGTVPDKYLEKELPRLYQRQYLET